MVGLICKEGEIIDNQELDYYIEKFNTEKDIMLNSIDNICIFNYLKELKMYKAAGTVSEVFDLKGKYKTIKFSHDLQCDIINMLEKQNGDFADRIVKAEGLISERKIQ